MANRGGLSVLLYATASEIVLEVPVRQGVSIRLGTYLEDSELGFYKGDYYCYKLQLSDLKMKFYSLCEKCYFGNLVEIKFGPQK